MGLSEELEVLIMPQSTKNRIVTYVSFEKEIFRKLEEARGIATRSAYINKLLKDKLRRQTDTSPDEV